MADYWKSTEKYWCKHCAVYVRDTKLERSNHEATAKHQGAIKRYIRDLHRSHDQEERDKERAKREINRLNGTSSSSTAPVAAPPPAPKPKFSGRDAGPATAEQLKKQREQLAEMGVAVPSEFRPEMAMAGEWTVTSTRVVEERNGEDGEVKEKVKEEVTKGARKREQTEEEREEEEAMQGLFKKPRRWGRDSKVMPQDEDADLDKLLSGGLPLKRAEMKMEPEGGVKEEASGEDATPIKQEDEPDVTAKGPTVKTEADDAPAIAKEEASEAPAVVFKKRKGPKGIRQK